MIGNLEFAQETAYSYPNRVLTDGVVEAADDEQPRQSAAREIGLAVTTAVGSYRYAVTTALSDPVGAEKPQQSYEHICEDKTQQIC